MKIRYLVASLLLLMTLTTARAQNYAIDWYTIDGGGGTSTGGVFSVSGTIGQPDAGVMSGGNFTVQGGFWGGIVAVQTEGGPKLFIENLLNGTARITWVPNTPGFVLQQVTALTPMPVSTGWSNAPAGFTNGVIIPASPQMRYFRLFKP